MGRRGSSCERRARRRRQDYEAREYITALEHFTAIEPLLTTLEKRAGAVLAAQLKSGATALQEGRSADAKSAFGLAVKIEPGNKVAAHGLKRATTWTKC